MEYWSNQLTIAPGMVLFNVNFVFPQSRGCAIIIFGENTCQRLQIFQYLNYTKQEFVQNGSHLV